MSMTKTLRSTGGALAAAALLGACTIVADRRPPPPPPAYGGVEHRAHERQEARVHARFAERQREAAHEYYRHEFRRGKCPPGLKKKHNGCMPPGQARKWRRGAPLPRGVAVYDVPHDLVVRIGPPPPGYRYVRVASDILMIAVGTAVVVDAIEDLHR
jgi:Ni/Co efflux regulator RcnB